LVDGSSENVGIKKHRNISPIKVSLKNKNTEI
jgi:hypothetical protein